MGFLLRALQAVYGPAGVEGCWFFEKQVSLPVVYFSRISRLF